MKRKKEKIDEALDLVKSFGVVYKFMNENQELLEKVFNLHQDILLMERAIAGDNSHPQKKYLYECAILSWQADSICLESEFEPDGIETDDELRMFHIDLTELKDFDSYIEHLTEKATQLKLQVP